MGDRQLDPVIPRGEREPVDDAVDLARPDDPPDGRLVERRVDGQHPLAHRVVETDPD